MEVTYRRNLNKSYMCVEEDGQILEGYELRMLENGKIPGLLPMQTTVSDGKRRYLYDISGKQQILDYISGRKMDYELLQRLLFSLQGVCSSLAEYLLREDGIYLELEFIYVNLEDHSLQYTYLPFYEKSLTKAFEACMEQILRRIDHKDQAAADLAYQVYQLCTRDNACITKILETIWKKKLCSEEICENGERGQESERKRENREKEGKGKGETAAQKENAIISGWQTEKKEEAGKEEMPLHFPEFFQKYFPGLWRMVCHVTDKRDQEKPGKRKKAGADSFKGFSNINILKKEKKVFQPEHRNRGSFPEDRKSPVHPTEILGAKKSEPVGKLVYQGIHQCRDIFIQGEIFLLGKNQEQVDGIIDAEGVSRLHARITRQEDQYFIEDLNSTNGTYLNGEVLEYHQPRELNRNDRIRFGMEEYVFS